MPAIQPTGVTFQISNAKLYVPVITLSVNDNMTFLENIKQVFERTIFWSKYRSGILTQPKSNRLILLSFKTDNHPTRNNNPARN